MNPPQLGTPAFALYMELYRQIGQAVLAWNHIELSVEVIAAYVHVKIKHKTKGFPIFHNQQLEIVTSEYLQPSQLESIRSTLSGLIQDSDKLGRIRNAIVHGVMTEHHRFETDAIATFRRMTRDGSVAYEAFSLAEIGSFTQDVLALVNRWSAFQDLVLPSRQ
jgi:hypothetical protein